MAPDTWQKALDINLDSSRYGSFAEIGAGQEVVRWFFRVGGAAGTVAKSMSAYDMKVSDEIYGRADRYVSRSLDGPLQGAEIWTRVSPVAAARTDIEVEFLVPGARTDSIDALGAAYTSLYTTLWDEDERMMVHRQAMLDARRAPPLAAALPVELGSVEQVRAKLPLLVESGGRRYRIVEVEGELRAHATVCPHMLGPLDEVPVEDGCIECPWHGYRFDLRTGRSSDGRGPRLPRAPEVIAGPDGLLRLVPA